MARPRKEEDEKAVGLHTTIPPKVDKEMERRRKETGATRAFIVTQALVDYLEIPEDKELIAS